MTLRCFFFLVLVLSSFVCNSEETCQDTLDDFQFFKKTVAKQVKQKKQLIDSLRCGNLCACFDITFIPDHLYQLKPCVFIKDVPTMVKDYHSVFEGIVDSAIVNQTVWFDWKCYNEFYKFECVFMYVDVGLFESIWINIVNFFKSIVNFVTRRMC